MEGLLLFYKPKNWRNRDILKFFQGVFPNVKIGHSGTLDPFTEGLMVMGLGRKFTKKLHNLLLHSQKEYVAEIEFGKTSDTFDIDGEITETNSKFQPTKKEIEKIIEKEFFGEKSQTPPVYSAKKHRGKRLRDIADKTEAEEIAKSKAKKVTLYDFEIISYKYPYLEIKLLVSSGFYIRSFANDLGKELKTGAYLVKLKRTRLGDYSVENALNPDDFPSASLGQVKTIELYGKIFGDVQGVGFRYFINSLANKFNLNGYARNADDGSVEFSMQGGLEILKKFQNEIKTGPVMARIYDYEFIIKKPPRLATDKK